MFINFFEIAIICLIKKIFKMLKISELEYSMPAILLGYTFFLLVMALLPLFLYYRLDLFISNHDIFARYYIGKTSAVYISVLVSILVGVIGSNIIVFSYAVKIFGIKINNKEQYNLLNYYFYMIFSVLLKIFEVPEDCKTIIDALFYSMSVVSMISTARHMVSKPSRR
jgi:hypothetical protein